MSEYYIFADSTNRDKNLYPNGNSYTLHLTKTLRNVTQVDLVSAKIPNTLYNFPGGSNVLTVNSVPINLPPGFYNACDISDYLTTQTGLKVSYLSSEGKLLFSSGNQFTINVNDTSLQKIIGLSNGISTFDSILGFYTVKSNSIIELSTNEFVFLDIEELRNQKVIDSKKLIGDSYDGATIATSFSMIPLDVPSSVVKTFKETTDYKISIQFDHPIPSVSRLNVRWLDHTGKLLNFNGVDNNSFLMRFHCNPSAPPEEKESEYEILAKKIERAIQDAIPPPKPEKKKPWIIPLFIIMFLIIVYLYKFRPS